MIRSWHQGLAATLLALMFAPSAALAQAAPILVAFIESSYWLPSRALCSDGKLASDPQISPKPGLATFEKTTLAPCAPPARPPLAASRAEAKQMVTSTVAPRPAGIAPFGFPNQWNNGLITLGVGASATAVNATAFAGLYRSETGGAKTRWSLTNTTGTARVARIDCWRSVVVNSGPAGAVVGRTRDTYLAAAVTLERFRGVSWTTACEPGDDPEPAGDLTQTAFVCLGAHASIDVLMEGTALARVQSTTSTTSFVKAAASVEVVITNLQSDGKRYDTCDAEPFSASFKMLPAVPGLPDADRGFNTRSIPRT
jgi:hypothetical protein